MQTLHSEVQGLHFLAGRSSGKIPDRVQILFDFAGPILRKRVASSLLHPSDSQTTRWMVQAMAPTRNDTLAILEIGSAVLPALLLLSLLTAFLKVRGRNQRVFMIRRLVFWARDQIAEQGGR